MPLSHSPGHAQADFGEAMAVIGGALRKIHFLAFDLPHSDGCFVAAYPAETTEAFCDGPQRGVCLLRRRPPIHPVRQHQAGGCPDPGRWEAAANARLHGASVPLSVRGQVRPAGQGQRQRARSRDWSASSGGTSWSLSRVPRASRPSTMLSPNSAAGARRRGCGATRRPSAERLERDRQVLLPLPPAPYDACDKRPWTGEFAVAGALPQQRLFRARGLRPP